MATIVQRITGQTWEDGLRMGSESLMRKAFFGRLWNRIRLGIIFSFTPNSTAQDIRDLQLNLGLVAGNYPLTHPLCDYGVGVCANGSIGRDQGFNTSYSSTTHPFRPLYSFATGTRAFQQQRESYVIYTGGNANAAVVVDADAVSNFMVPFFIDFNRPQATLAGSWTITTYTINATAATANIGWKQSHLSDALETWSTPTVNGVSFVTASFTPQVSEFGGELDKICVSWNSDAHPITLWAIGASLSYDQSPTYLGYTASNEDFSDYAYTGTLYSATNPSFSGTVGEGRWGFYGTGVIYP